MNEKRVFVRTSDRRDFLRCRQAWWWSYVEQRQVKDSWSPALIFGDMVHRALAEYYVPETTKQRQRGPHPAKTFAKIYDLMEEGGRTFNVRTDDEKWVAARELGIEMMENYVDEWREEDKDILILYPEMPFQFDIMDPDTGKYLCTYVGTTDALVKRISSGQVGLFEHKTAATIDTSHLFMDEQAGTYWTIIPEWLRREEIFKKMPEFSFMLYNFMRKAQRDTRPQNRQGQYLNMPTKEDLVSGLQPKVGATYNGKLLSKYVKDDLITIASQAGINPDMLGQPSKTQPPPLFHREDVYRSDTERMNTFTRIVDHVREMNAVRRGEMRHYKMPSKDCGWCQWRDLCELHEQGDDWEELRKVATRKWDPYKDHVWALDLQ